MAWAVLSGLSNIYINCAKHRIHFSFFLHYPAFQVIPLDGALDQTKAEFLHSTHRYSLYVFYCIEPYSNNEWTKEKKSAMSVQFLLKILNKSNQRLYVLFA